MLETSSLCYESPSLVFLYRLILDINRREVNWRRGMQKWAQNCQASCFFKPEFFFTDYLHYYIFSSVQFSRSVVSDSLWPHESQHARPPCPSPTPGAHSDSVHRVGDAIQPSHPLSSPSPPAANPSQHQSLFQWVNSSHEVAKVLEFQL